MNHLCRGIALQTAHRAKKATGHTQAVREALAVGDPGKTRFLGPKSHVYVFVYIYIYLFIYIYIYSPPPPPPMGMGGQYRLVLLVPPTPCGLWWLWWLWWWYGSSGPAPPVACGGGMLVCWYVGMLGWRDGWMDGWMDVWMYGCMDVWMYGCMDGCMHACMYVCT